MCPLTPTPTHPLAPSSSAPPASPREALPSSSSTVPVPVPRPDLSPSDCERIETWFEHDSRLTEVAQALGIGVLTLSAWAKQPHIKEALLDICDIARFRTETLRAEAEHASVNRLLSLVRNSDHEEIARRAAANILGMGLRRGTGLPPGVFSSPSPTPPPRDPPQPLDNPPSHSVPTIHVPTPPLPRLTPAAPTPPNTSANPIAPTRLSPHSPFQFSKLKVSSLPPRPQRLSGESPSLPPFPVPVRPPPPSPPFPVPVPRPASPIDTFDILPAPTNLRGAAPCVHPFLPPPPSSSPRPPP